MTDLMASAGKSLHAAAEGSGNEGNQNHNGAQGQYIWKDLFVAGQHTQRLKSLWSHTIYPSVYQRPDCPNGCI